MARKAIQHDFFKKPGRKRKRPLTKQQDKFVTEFLKTGDREKATALAGYAPSTQPNRIKAVQVAIEDRQKEMMKSFLNEAQEMKENMLDLARNADSESVRFQATKDMLDRAGLNPINKNQTQTAKYVSIESRFSRDALSRFEKEEINKEAGE